MAEKPTWISVNLAIKTLRVGREPFIREANKLNPPVETTRIRNKQYIYVKDATRVYVVLQKLKKEKTNENERDW